MRKPRTGKYNNRPVYFGGERFASQKEFKRHNELLLLQRGGVIEDLKRQPKFPLVVNDVKVGLYIGDWLYLENGCVVVEDAKGMQTPLFKLKFALCKALWPNTEWRLS